MSSAKDTKSKNAKVLQNMNRVYAALQETIGKIRNQAKDREDSRVSYDHYRLKL